jgi:hypothetical protein
MKPPRYFLGVFIMMEFHLKHLAESDKRVDHNTTQVDKEFDTRVR